MIGFAGAAVQTGASGTRKQYGQTAPVDAASAFMPVATKNILSKLRLADNAFAKSVTDESADDAFAVPGAGTKNLARVQGYKDGNRGSEEQLTKDFLVASAFSSIGESLSQSISSANARSAREDTAKKQKLSTEHALFLRELLDRGSRAYTAGVKAGLSGDIVGRELAGQQFAESVGLLQSAAQEGVLPAQSRRALQILSRAVSAGGSDLTISDADPAQQSVDTRGQGQYTENIPDPDGNVWLTLLKNDVNQMLNGAKKILDPVVNYLTDGYKPVWDEIRSWVVPVANELKDVWNDTKWAFQPVIDVADKAQKAAQREFWQTGSQLYLRSIRGFESAAELLEHSLQDHPKPIYRDSESKLAGQLAESKEVNDMIDRLIAGSDGEVFPIDNEKVTFKSGDLFYSLHTGTINGEGVRQSDGSWLITGTLTDLYDFTEFTTLMNEKKYSPDISLGSIANDAAALSQMTGAISDYKVTVDFVIRR